MKHLSCDRDALERLCRRYRVRRLALFGSLAKGTERLDSDVDLLVEFEPGAAPGLLGLAKIEAELSELLGRPVDLRTRNELSRYFRQAVEDTVEVQFVA